MTEVFVRPRLVTGKRLFATILARPKGKLQQRNGGRRRRQNTVASLPSLRKCGPAGWCAENYEFRNRNSLLRMRGASGINTQKERRRNEGRGGIAAIPTRTIVYTVKVVHVLVSLSPGKFLSSVSHRCFYGPSFTVSSIRM